MHLNKQSYHNIKFLDGLRGILCLIVIIDHCVNILMPSLRYTNASESNSILKQYVALSPLNILYSGIPSVCIFFIISGFVISYKYNKTKKAIILARASVKRYFRFAIPILFAYIFMYCIYTYTKTRISFHYILKQSLYSAEFVHGSFINYVLWTIPYEFYGSLLIFALLSIFGHQKYRIFFYFIVLLFTFNTYYTFFIYGLILSDLTAQQKIHFKCSVFIKCCGFAIALFLITYPYQRPGVHIGGIYNIITFTQNWEKNYLTCLKIGCIVLFYIIMISNTIKKILQTNIILFIGKISFPIYLLHASIIHLIFTHYGQTKTFTEFLLLLLLVISLTIIIAIPFERYIDQQAIKLSNKIANFFIK